MKDKEKKYGTKSNVILKLAALIMAISLSFIMFSCKTEADDGIPSYTVTFESSGGSPVISQTVKSGKKATKPTAPTKTGFVFDRWYYDNSPFDFSTPITGGITLTAKWNPITYTIKFDKNGGEGSMGDISMEYNEEKKSTGKRFYKKRGLDFPRLERK